MGADVVGFAAAVALVGPDVLGVGAAFVVDGGVGDLAGEADAVAYDAASSYGAAECAGDEQQGAFAFVATGLPAVAEEGFALEVAVEFVGELDAEVLEDVFFERFWVEHCIFLQKVLVIEIKAVLLQCSIGITLRDPLLFFFFIKWF